MEREQQNCCPENGKMSGKRKQYETVKAGLPDNGTNNWENLI